MQHNDQPFLRSRSYKNGTETGVNWGLPEQLIETEVHCVCVWGGDLLQYESNSMFKTIMIC